MDDPSNDLYNIRRAMKQMKSLLSGEVSYQTVSPLIISLFPLTAH